MLDWIERRQGDLYSQLRSLVSTPSIVGDELSCQELVASNMRAVCDEVEVWEPDVAWLEAHPAYFPRGISFAGRPNVVGRVRGKGGGRSLVINAHVDVVETGPEEAWRFNPWSGAIAEGVMHGRGVMDDKAGLAIMLSLALGWRELGICPLGDVILESVADEEWGGGGTLATLQRGYIADAAILFEPTDLAICPAARGGQAYRVTVQGRGAHPIRAYEGVSALDKAIPLLQALRALEADRQERFRTELFAPYPIFMPITVGTISADEFPSKVPEKCVFQGLYGFSPDETYQEARLELEACIAATAAADPWLAEHPPVVQWPGLCKEGGQTSPSHPIVQLMGEAFTEITGDTPDITGFTSGCDFPYLTRYAGMPGLIFGPGNATLAHTSSEQVELADVLAAAKTLSQVILRWCGV